MTKLRITRGLTLFAGLVVLAGCEHDSGSSSASVSAQNNPSLFHEDSVVSGVNDGAPGVIPDVITADGDWLFTDNAIVSFLRDSCSGFSADPIDGAAVGLNVRFYYDPATVNFGQSPPQFFPVEIYFWDTACGNPFGTPPSHDDTNHTCSAVCPFAILD
jgi:hypothetical protein